LNILIVDDHPLYIDGLKTTLIKKIENLDIMESYSVEAALRKIGRNPNINLILVDLNLPQLGGIDLLQSLLEKGITIPAVAISGDNDPEKIKQALDLGACGFIPKSYASDRFIMAINHVIDGGIFITEEIQRQISSLDRVAANKRVSSNAHMTIKLTPRQYDVLKLMRKGYSNKQISNELNVSIDTIKEHVRNLFLVFDVNNRVSCLYRAEELGFDIKE